MIDEALLDGSVGYAAGAANPPYIYLLPKHTGVECKLPSAVPSITE